MAKAIATVAADRPPATCDNADPILKFAATAIFAVVGFRGRPHSVLAAVVELDFGGG